MIRQENDKEGPDATAERPLLGLTPVEWTPELRRNNAHGTDFRYLQ